MQKIERELTTCPLIHFVATAISGYWNAAIIVSNLSRKTIKKRKGVIHANNQYRRTRSQNRMFLQTKRNMKFKRINEANHKHKRVRTESDSSNEESDSDEDSEDEGRPKRYKMSKRNYEEEDSEEDETED
ncbi:MAG: hypothetical protein FD143_3344 [Ignavibacteria bacterium]|nr:MAG: hypothetical protein FD143_3344 [Ignavibacteria bacterium]